MTEVRQWDVVVVGSVNTDYVAKGERLPQPGETVSGDTFLIEAGGKGANQAVAAARLGGRVALVARVGADDRGDDMLRHLAGESVDTRHVQRDPEAPTGATLIFVDDQGQKTIAAVLGANRRFSVEDVHAARDTIASARVLLTQLEVPLEPVLEATRIAHDAGARVVLDPAPAIPLPDDLLRLLDVIRPNAGEAEKLTGVHVHDRDSARAAALRLLDRGVGAVGVQAGQDGNLLVWRGGERWMPLLPVNSVDATGAGDAFAAALAVALAEGRSLDDAGPFANAAAALATTALGAQGGLPTRDQVLALLDQHDPDAARRWRG